MCVVIDSKAIISNAFYAYFKQNKENSIIEYSKIDKYRKFLYKKITTTYRYVLFSDDDSECYNIYDHAFVKIDKGVWCINSVDDNFIKEVNAIYPTEIQKILEKSYEEMKF